MRTLQVRNIKTQTSTRCVAILIKMDKLQNILQRIGEKELGTVDEIIFKSNSFEGEGFLGIVEAVDVKGSSSVLSLVAKSANLSKAITDNIPLAQCVNTEVVFYEKIVPAFDKLNLNSERISTTPFPRCFHANKNLIIMENLKTQGFVILDKMKPMDSAHVEAALREYANLHAYSLAFKQEFKEEFDAFSKVLGDNIKNWMVIGKMMDSCIKNLEYIKGKLDVSMHAKLSEFIYSAREFVLEHDFAGDEFAVVSHADCWCNNIMFNYEHGTTKIKSTKIIDYQLTRCSNFICDLTHFMATCCDFSVWNNVDQHLELYHAALSTRMKALGAKKVVSLEEVMEQFRKYAKYGLIVMAFFLKVTYIQPHEAPTHEDIVTGRFIEAFCKELENERFYVEKMKFLVEFYYKNNLL